MEEMMSHIMRRAAGMKRAAEDNSPLDLTRTKLLRHTCDRLVDHEDLRSGSDSNLDRDVVSAEGVYEQPSLSLNVIPSTNARRVLTFDSASIRVKQQADIEHKVSPHPYSIEALLGDICNKKSDGTSPPAVVYSYQSARTPRTTDKEQITSELYLSMFDTSYWCHACNSFCTDNKDAQGHHYLHHMQGIRCSLKKEFFKTHGYVTKHVTIDPEKVQCGLCDRIVAQCFFSKHQRLHDGHFCRICKHEFSSNSRLQDHMNIHTGSTPFSCKICDRKFAKRSSLTQHQRYHRDHQSFKCNYCHKYFSSKYTRAVHERLHTRDNPFKCQVPGCTRAFPQKIQLQLHMNIHS